ncbi:hypothetical protein ACROYT_G031494 [Oculina patagonica]
MASSHQSLRKSKSKMAEKEQCVREFSSFLSRTAQEMEKVLCKFKWKKESLMKKVNSSRLVHCPINPSHRIPTSRLEKHLTDACSSPEFFYQSSKSVIPVFIDEKQYNTFKNGSERRELDQEPHNIFLRKGNPLCCNIGKSFEERQEISNQNIITNEQMICSDNIRSIMAWEVVPASHTRLDLHLLSQDKIKTWIIGNLPQVQYLSSLEGASDHLVNFVLSCLQEEKVAHPSGMEEMLKDLLGNETQSFVLKLWKFLAVSIASEKSNANQSSMEDGRQERLGINTTSNTDSLHSVPVENYVKEIPLPMDRVINDLLPQQRLAVYEHVLQVSKAKREGQKEDVDLEGASDANDSKDTEDQPKSRFEVLAEQRDYKRRRQSYRAKNVHITKRSAVEVMRDLIETQMHVLETQLREEHGISGNNSNEEEVSQERRDSRDQKDNTRRDGRDEEGSWRMERDRKQHKEGSKRVRYHDDRDDESKRSRR